MANILDYLDWRGDIPFSTDPFNEVDSLVLSELSYCGFEGIVPGFPESKAAVRDTVAGENAEKNIKENALELKSVSIREAAEAFWGVHTMKEIQDSGTLFKRAPLLLDKLCSGARFGNMRLTGYVNKISSQKNEQMSAVTILLNDETTYVAFRGTDDTMIGWKEDFYFGFQKETAGQKSASEYLNSMFCRGDDGNETGHRRIIVGGHSKGGNFAVFASAFCDASVRDRITDVYTHDGPGLLEEVTDTKEYREILPRVHSIIPEESIFGLLLECGYYHKVIRSSAKGILQHDALTWKVSRNRFEEAKAVSELSLLMERAVENWIRGMTIEERREVVDTIFTLFDETGVENLSEITTDQVRGITELFRTYRDMNPEEKYVLRETARRLFRSGAGTLSEELQGKLAALKERRKNKSKSSHMAGTNES